MRPGREYGEDVGMLQLRRELDSIASPEQRDAVISWVVRKLADIPRQFPAAKTPGMLVAVANPSVPLLTLI